MHAAIVGLGNPGPRYAATRHNVGFMVVDALAARCAAMPARATRDLVLADVVLGRRAVLLAKPMSYMNLSGEPVSALCAWRGISPAKLLVVHDELDLPFGRLKLKRGGGSAGHRGLASIAASLDTGEFHRLRVGIGRPPAGGEVADFVLEGFDGEELAALPSLLERAADACALWLELGIEAAMGRVNADVDRGQAGPDPAPDPAAPGSRTP